MSALEEQSKKYIVIKSSGTQQIIYIKDIFYIESSNKKVIYHTKNGRFDTYGKMEEQEKALGNAFYRCHRCYLVNMEKFVHIVMDVTEKIGNAVSSIHTETSIEKNHIRFDMMA